MGTFDKNKFKQQLQALIGSLGEDGDDGDGPDAESAAEDVSDTGMDKDDGAPKGIVDMSPEGFDSMPDEQLKVPPISSSSRFSLPAVSAPKDYQSAKEKELGLKTAAAAIKRRLGK